MEDILLKLRNFLKKYKIPEFSSQFLANVAIFRHFGPHDVKEGILKYKKPLSKNWAKLGSVSNAPKSQTYFDNMKMVIFWPL